MSDVFQEGWKPVPCEGHGEKCRLWDDLGYDATKCPTCGAHVREGICLNTCHLSRRMQQKFADAMRTVTK